MSEPEGKPSITVLYSFGLMNRPNRQTLSELGDELTEPGYPATVDVRPPPGQFSVINSLEQILIVVSSAALAGGVVFSKKYLELAAEHAWKRTEAKLPKLKSSKPDSDNLAVVVTVEVDGKQVKNVLYRGPDNIKELPTRPDKQHGHTIERNDSGSFEIRRSDGSWEQRWNPPQ